MILLLDNYDSFVFNLARYISELGETSLVRRHDAVSIEEIERLAPTHILISPGPCTPREAGISTDVVRHLGARIPILGVCLGHQCIAQAYGAEIVRAERPVHGKPSSIHHEGTGIFTGIPSPFQAARYHSLAIAEGSLPPSLRVTARSEDGEIMAIEHRTHPVVGVQFHPESAISEYGYHLLERFVHGDRADTSRLPARADLGHAASRRS